MATKDVYVGVASIPGREASLRKVVAALLPQVRRMGVYLNGYQAVPRFLRDEKIDVARSQDHGDVRDNGKFFFLDRATQRYYASVDDDIAYPADYIGSLVDALDESEQLAAVGVHGALYPHPVVDLFDARVLLHFERPMPHVTPVHLLGTGTTMIDQSVWALRFGEFGTPGMADIWFASAARRRGASCFAVSRRRRWLEPITRERSPGGALYHEGLHQSSEQVAELRGAAPSSDGLDGLVSSLIASSVFAERFSVHQALELDAVRRQLGFAPVSEPVASKVLEALRRSGNTSLEVIGRGVDDLAAHAHLVVGVLAGTASAESVAPALRVLDRASGLASSDPKAWSGLPYGVRFDSRPDRWGEIRAKLLSAGMAVGPEDARRLFPLCRHPEGTTIDQALAAERAAIDTRFERLPALTARVRDHPDAAAQALYEYLQIVGGERTPDVAAIRTVFGDAASSLDVALPVCQAAIRSGDRELGRRLLADLQRRFPWEVDVQLMSARFDGEPARGGAIDLAPALRVLDETLERERLTPLTALYTEPVGDHWIDALRSQPLPAAAAAEPDVSVIMTTHNDVTTIAAAAGSILASEDVDVQLVIVDDLSDDGTIDVLDRLADPRVVVVANDTNVGPYVSRNRALARCTGRYVAIADADDWSHPQRLAFQLRLLDEMPYVHACKVAHLRIRPNGEIDLENNRRFVGEGPMSLMYRRWLTDHIGGFDRIRTRGDVEFMRRLRARFGDGALLSTGTPLVLATSSPVSNSKRFAEDSLNLYRSASKRWHERHLGRDSLYVPIVAGRAGFLAPHELVVPDAPSSAVV